MSTVVTPNLAAEVIINYCLAEIPESVRGFEKLLGELKASGAKLPPDLAQCLAAASAALSDLAGSVTDGQ